MNSPVCLFFSDGDAVLIEGLLFRTSYLGSTKLISECNPTRVKRMKQAKEAVDCVKVGIFLLLDVLCQVTLSEVIKFGL